MCAAAEIQPSVLVFQSLVFDTTWKEWEESDAEPPIALGGDIATYLAACLREKGITILHDAECDAEHGDWNFSVAHRDVKYNVSVGRDRIGRSSDDVWIVQLRKRVGCTGGILELFGRRDFEDVQPVREVLDEIVADDATFTDIRWLSFREFISAH